MTFFCFIECSNSAVPYMEPFQADHAEAAVEQARRMMADHPEAVTAHLYYGDERIATLTAEAETV